MRYSLLRICYLQLTDTSRLSVSKSDRRFDSRSLYHTVYSAEKSASVALKIPKNARDYAVLAFKPDQRKSRSQLLSSAFGPFSLEGRHALRFQRLREANALGSKNDDVAKAA